MESRNYRNIANIAYFRAFSNGFIFRCVSNHNITILKFCTTVFFSKQIISDERQMIVLNICIFTEFYEDIAIMNIDCFSIFVIQFSPRKRVVLYEFKHFPQLTLFPSVCLISPKVCRTCFCKLTGN